MIRPPTVAFVALSHLTNSLPADTESSANLGCRSFAFEHFKDFGRVSDSHAIDETDSAATIFDAVSCIISSGEPFQIGVDIVLTISIFVVDRGIWHRRCGQESLSNKAMHHDCFAVFAAAERDLKVGRFVGCVSLLYWSRNDLTNAAKTRYLVDTIYADANAGDDFPYFLHWIS